MDAAREMFRDQGYGGTSLRQIAARVNTPQATVYRYFDSKSALFEAAILEPFESFLAELNDQWAGTDATKLSNDDLIAGLTRQFYDFAVTHRADLMTLIAASRFDDDAPPARQRFTDLVRDVTRQALEQRSGRAWDSIDIEVAIPLTITMMFSAAMLEDWFFPADEDRPDRGRILTELTAFGQARSAAGCAAAPRGNSAGNPGSE